MSDELNLGGDPPSGGGPGLGFPGGGGGGQFPSPPPNPTPDTPVSPTILEEETAEDRLKRLEGRAAELEAENKRLREQLVRAERRRSIDAALVEASAIDLETARLVVESELSQADDPSAEDAVARAVEVTRASKPFLFGAASEPSFPAGGAMAPMAAPPDGDGLEDLASSARSSGDRRELMRYLRARRGA